MNIVKINNTTYRIFDKNNNNPLKILIPQISSPFGTEIFNGVTYLNLEINNNKSNHSNLLGDLYKIEDYFKQYINDIDKNIEWISSIKKKENYKPLWKVRIQKFNNRYRVDTYMNKNLCTWYELLKYNNNFKNDCTMEIILHSLWVNNNKAGLLWFVNKINAYTSLND